MERHPFDLLSFVFGLIFVAVATVALLGVEVVALRDLAWVLPTVLVVIGAALLLTSATRRSTTDEEQAGEPLEGSTTSTPVPDVAPQADGPAEEAASHPEDAVSDPEDAATQPEDAASGPEDVDVPRR